MIMGLGSQIGKWVTKKFLKEGIEGVAKETAKGVAKETAEGIAKETAEGVAKSVAKEAAEGVAKSTVKEVGEQTAKKATKEVAEEVVEEATEQTAKKATKEAVEEATEQTAKKATKEAVEEAAEKATKTPWNHYKASENIHGFKGHATHLTGKAGEGTLNLMADAAEKAGKTGLANILRKGAGNKYVSGLMGGLDALMVGGAASSLATPAAEAVEAGEASVSQASADGSGGGFDILGGVGSAVNAVTDLVGTLGGVASSLSKGDFSGAIQGLVNFATKHPVASIAAVAGGSMFMSGFVGKALLAVGGLTLGMSLVNGGLNQQDAATASSEFNSGQTTDGVSEAADMSATTTFDDVQAPTAADVAAMDAAADAGYTEPVSASNEVAVSQQAAAGGPEL